MNPYPSEHWSIVHIADSVGSTLLRSSVQLSEGL